MIWEIKVYFNKLLLIAVFLNLVNCKMYGLQVMFIHLAYLAGEFCELRSTHLKVQKVEKYWFIG